MCQVVVQSSLCYSVLVCTPSPQDLQALVPRFNQAQERNAMLQQQVDELKASLRDHEVGWAEGAPI